MRTIISAIGVLFLLSCSDRLSKAKAQKLITEKYSFPITEDEFIPYGIISSDTDSLPGYYYLLQNAGMFTINYMGEKNTEIFGVKYQYKVVLTNKGKKYLNNKIDVRNPKSDNTENMVGRFTTCNVHFKEVKELHEIPETNAAVIKFVVQRNNFTPFWNFYLDPSRNMPDTIQLRTLNAVKTNGGWKLVK